jgi:hypothetical protein
MDKDKKEWTCPKCQIANDPEFTRCRKCGDWKPGTPEADKFACKACGTHHSGACCPTCGSKEFLQL